MEQGPAENNANRVGLTCGIFADSETWSAGQAGVGAGPGARHRGRIEGVFISQGLDGVRFG